MIMEPTEEQRQLAEQARTYGKHMVALQSGEGGEGGPPTPVQDEPVAEPAQSVRDGKQTTYWSSNVCTLRSEYGLYIHEHTFLFSRHYVCRYTGCGM